MDDLLHQMIGSKCKTYKFTKLGVAVYYETPSGQCGATYSYAAMNVLYDKHINKRIYNV